MNDIPVISILLWSSLGAAGTLSGLVFFSRGEWLSRNMRLVVSFSAGVILATTFLNILPEAFEQATQSVSSILVAVFVGFLFFYIFERLFFWAHCHDGKCDVHAPGYMVMIGDTVHNFTDGILIAATFLVDPTVGVLTAIAVALHEIPQEFGEFVIFVESGMSKNRALTMNILSALAAPIGAIVAVLLLSSIEPFLGIIIAIAGGGFLYVAAADLIPDIHTHPHGHKDEHPHDATASRSRHADDWANTGFLLLGVLVIVVMTILIGGVDVKLDNKEGKHGYDVSVVRVLT